MMKEFLVILLTAAITNNYVLVKFLGICPFLGVSKKLDQATGMSIAVIFVMLLATAVTWPIQYYVLNPNGLGYMQTIVFILVIAALVQMLELLLKKFSPALHKGLGVYLPLITTNCAVLGVALQNITKGYNLLESLTYGVGGGLGFLLVIVLFAGIRERLETSDIAPCFKGFPIALITAGLMSVAFMGFSGMIQ